MPFKDYRLFRSAAGLRAVHKSAAPGTRVSHLCVLIEAGSGMEDLGEWGMAHFTEHMLFKGTKKRGTSRILNRLELAGGEINAFTTREYTCIHASFLNEHLQKAVDLLADMIFNSTFLEKEIEHEKSVILDEIDSYRDMPEESIQDDFDEALLPGHPFFRNILGSRESVLDFSRNDLVSWSERNFELGKIIVGLSSSISANRFLNYTARYFLGTHDSFEPGLGFSEFELAAESEDTRSEHTNILAQHITFQKKFARQVTQVHSMIGSAACTLFDKRRPAMLLLNNLLGGPGMTSRLNMEIREKRGICYTIESSYVPFKNAGVFSIYFGTEAGKAVSCMSLVRKELDRLCNVSLSKLELSQAKSRFKGQIALAEEARVSVVISICKSILDFGRADTLPQLFVKVDKITAAELQELACETFNPSQMSSIILSPEI